MNFQLNVTGQTLSVKQNLIAADTIDYLTAAVSLSADWSGLSVWVHFKKGETHHTIELTGSAITRDQHLNLSSGVWSVWLHGNAISGGTVTQRITSTVAALNITSTGSTAANPLPVTPTSVGEQILAKAANAESIAQSVRADADAGEFNGATGAAGQNGADCDYSLVANAFRGKLTGTAARVDDVSPLANNLSVVQYGQCAQDGTPTPTTPIPITGKVAGATVGDGTVTTQTLTVTDEDGDPVTLYGIPVAGGGNVTIGTQQYIADTLDGTTVTRRIASVDMGTLTWAFSDNLFFRCKTLADKSPGYYNLLCSSYLVSQASGAGGIQNNEVIGTATNSWVQVRDDAFTNAVAFKAAMSGVLLYYELAEPITEAVTLSPEALSANSPTTTWTSEAYSEVTYNRDINKAFQELTAAIISLGGNI